MKKITMLLLAGTMLLGLAACGPGDFPSSSVAGPGTLSESRAESTTHEAEPTPTPSIDPSVGPDETSSEGEGGYDPLVSSPYYSGQGALLEDLQKCGNLPEEFYWINEEKVRETWGIDEFISGLCKDRVAQFDFYRQGEDGTTERFYWCITLGGELPALEADGNHRFTPVGEWSPAEGHPGFELMEVEAISLPIKPIDYFPGEEESASSEVSAEPTPEPTPMPWPNQFRVRWQAGECQVMLQLPSSALDAFWANVDELLTPVQALPPESRPEQSQPAETVPSVGPEE